MDDELGFKIGEGEASRGRGWGVAEGKQDVDLSTKKLYVI